MKKSILLFLVCWPAVLFADAKSFKIGVSIPLSGAFADFGMAVQNGIEIAKSDKPELFSHISFVFEDSAYDQKQAITNFHKLVDIDKVDVTYMWGVEPSRVTAPIAENLKAAMVAPTQFQEVSAGRNYVIRFINTGQEYSETLLEYLRTQNIKNIAVFQAQFSFFDMLVDGLKRSAKKENIEVLDNIPPAELDFKTKISLFKNKHFDILGVYLSPPQVQQFFKQAHDLDFHPKVFGATTFESRSIMGDSWPLMEGAVFTNNAATESFRSAYTLKFGNDVQLAYAANAYDFAALSAQLFGKFDTSSLSSEEIIKRYSQVPPMQGVSGPYYFKDNKAEGKHFEFDIVVRQIQNGTSREVFREGFGSKK
jgi:branched-chain amino acid transport system substrate-binding protein